MLHSHRGDWIIEAGHDDPYDHFFRVKLLFVQRALVLTYILVVFPAISSSIIRSPSALPLTTGLSLLEHHFSTPTTSRRVPARTSKARPQPANSQRTPEVKAQAGDESDESEQNVGLPDCPANTTLTTSKGKVEQREDPPLTIKLTGKENRNYRKRLMRA
ncbi:uncharacterized protein EDB91DRAFT_1313743 [Suillus paluster]|uniref:uncharacterized protein n=1 Tax=Suillus paluster TaxID=48578 RepID=UPI001B886481|nr:uncharacterized protein EDB91DRAFT_1313743 [Suillus paluster]KAG1728504.1 hypothetical protein EDB91DRAFT_1313743 [Suillus paluster]